jgi:hypothetical protein
VFDARDLKPTIALSDTYVECPVRGCTIRVERQRVSFKREKRFQCPDHGIYISPTTFEYPDETDNLLWKDSTDLSLLQAIKAAKRESRIARDNSEDALSWNVFRYLEKENRLALMLSSIAQTTVHSPELVYWSYSPIAKRTWPELTRARLEFGEALQRSSEPDLISVTDDALFFIEAKLTATNKTRPSNPKELKKYLTGGDQWYQKVFRSDYETIAIHSRKYELLRFWLLGSWIASQTGRAFYLINLVPSERERDIQKSFSQHIYKNAQRRFLRVTWEEIYQYIVDNAPPTPTRTSMLCYFENKTNGYNHLRKLQRAFSIPNTGVT